MSLQKQIVEREVRVCDVCGGTFDKAYKLPNCFICGLELCGEHQKSIGSLIFCIGHHKEVWNVITDMKKNYTEKAEQV